MKRLLLLLTIGVVLLTPCVYAEDEEIPQSPPPTGDSKPSPPPIVYIPIPGPTPPPDSDPDPEDPKPRIPSPISGVYANGVVDIFFAADLGSVTVTVTSIATGTMWTEDADSCDGVVSVNIGRAPGSYTINIDTETAGSFVGQFTI